MGIKFELSSDIATPKCSEFDQGNCAPAKTGRPRFVVDWEVSL